MVSVRVFVCLFLPFQSYLPLPNLPKLLFTERQLGSYNKKKIPAGGASKGAGQYFFKIISIIEHF
jgi:hypothetical protein